MATMCASILLFAVMDTIVKWLGAHYPTSQIVFFRCVLALPFIVILIIQAGGIQIVRTQQSGVHFLRAFCGVLSMALAFWGFSQMRLADAIAILFAAPILMTALSVPLLRERVGPRRWAAVFVGFIGVMVVVNPGGGVFDWAAIVVLIAAALMALAMIIIRKLAATESAVSITFWFTVAGCIFGTIWVMIEGWVPPVSLRDWGLLVSVGLLGSVAQYLMTVSFRHAEVALLAPLEYMSIFWTTLLAYWIWAEIPTFRVFVGAGIVIASGLYIVHRETRVAKVRPVKLPKLRGRI